MNQFEASLQPSARSSKIDAPRSNSPALAVNQNQREAPEAAAQMLSISSGVNYIKNQLKALLIDYPPFFPPGSPQRFDLIQGIKGIQVKIENAPIPQEIKKNLEGLRLTGQATDNDILAALKGLNSFRDLFCGRILL